MNNPFLLWTLILTTFALVLNTLEFIAMSPLIQNPQSPWHWSLLKDDHCDWPPILQRFLNFVFSDFFRPFLFLILIIAILLPWLPHWILALGLIAFHLLLQWRFRGIFNGGSDYMIMVLLLGIFFALVHPHDQGGQSLGLFFIAMTSTFSYFIAGLVKVRNPLWRKGLALQSFLLHSPYTVPTHLKRWGTHGALIRFLSGLTLIWECTFPIIWLIPRLAPAYLCLGLLFHLGNFWAFGINRFLFAWGATYPAILYFTRIS